jgi:hypothetical protein
VAGAAAELLGEVETPLANYQQVGKSSAAAQHGGMRLAKTRFCGSIKYVPKLLSPPCTVCVCMRQRAGSDVCSTAHSVCLAVENQLIQHAWQ